MIGKISKGEKSNASHRTIFEEVLESDLLPEQKKPERLGHEAQTVIGAGLVTTAWALAHSTFYILNDPETLKKLQAELSRAIPNPRTPVDWVKLEELPFLTGCVKESIRLSYGVTSRLPRISRDGPMKYKDWKIPTGTPVGMTIVDVHHDENVFPESQKFIPERWMNGARAPNGEPLERYLVAFGKGPRQCLGIKYVPCVVHVSCPEPRLTRSLV
jgi:cytochrome P450